MPMSSEQDKPIIVDLDEYDVEYVKDILQTLLETRDFPTNMLELSPVPLSTIIQAMYDYSQLNMIKPIKILEALVRYHQFHESKE